MKTRLVCAASIFALFVATASTRATNEGQPEEDQIGVTSETFYNNESLNRNGRWIQVEKYGRCWQPAQVEQGWRPYTRGGFRHSKEVGWTWVSDESEAEWGWATFHYGRWLRLEGVGCEWAWVPGTVWGPAWVSWRSGTDPSCTCVGWAPLPPEVDCKVNVGVNRWVDRRADIGPDNYTFIEKKNFGRENYQQCGCIVERQRYVDIVRHTRNITNISYVQSSQIYGRGRAGTTIYNGGPDLDECDAEAVRYGGPRMAQIQISRVADISFFAQSRGYRRYDGDVLQVFAPQITANVRIDRLPNVATTVSFTKVTRGWNVVQDEKTRKQLKQQFAAETKNLPDNAPATLDAKTKKQLFEQEKAFSDQKKLRDAGYTGSFDGKGADILKDYQASGLDARDYVKKNADKPGTNTTTAGPNGAPPAPSLPPSILKKTNTDATVAAEGGTVQIGKGNKGVVMTKDALTEYEKIQNTFPNATGTNDAAMALRTKVQKGETITVDDVRKSYKDYYDGASLKAKGSVIAQSSAAPGTSPEPTNAWRDIMKKDSKSAATGDKTATQTGTTTVPPAPSVPPSIVKQSQSSDPQNYLAKQGYQLPADPALRKQMQDAMNGQNPELAKSYAKFHAENPGKMPTDPALAEYVKMNAAGTGLTPEAWARFKNPDGTDVPHGRKSQRPPRWLSEAATANGWNDQEANNTWLNYQAARAQVADDASLTDAQKDQQDEALAKKFTDKNAPKLANQTLSGPSLPPGGAAQDQKSSSVAPITQQQQELKSPEQTLPLLANGSTDGAASNTPQGTPRIGSAVSIDEKGAVTDVPDGTSRIGSAVSIDEKGNVTETPEGTPRIGSAVSIDENGKVIQVPDGSTGTAASAPTGSEQGASGGSAGLPPGMRSGATSGPNATQQGGSAGLPPGTKAGATGGPNATQQGGSAGLPPGSKATDDKSRIGSAISVDENGKVTEVPAGSTDESAQFDAEIAKQQAKFDALVKEDQTGAGQTGTTGPPQNATTATSAAGLQSQSGGQAISGRGQNRRRPGQSMKDGTQTAVTGPTGAANASSALGNQEMSSTSQTFANPGSNSQTTTGADTTGFQRGGKSTRRPGQGLSGKTANSLQQTQTLQAQDANQASGNGQIGSAVSQDATGKVTESGAGGTTTQPTVSRNIQINKKGKVTELPVPGGEANQARALTNAKRQRRSKLNQTSSVADSSQPPGSAGQSFGGNQPASGSGGGQSDASQARWSKKQQRRQSEKVTKQSSDVAPPADGGNGSSDGGGRKRRKSQASPKLVQPQDSSTAQRQTQTSSASGGGGGGGKNRRQQKSQPQQSQTQSGPSNGDDSGGGGGRRGKKQRAGQAGAVPSPTP